MLNRTRNEVLIALQMKLENDLNLLETEQCDFTDMNDGEYYSTKSIKGRDQSVPNDQFAWPPGLQEYIRRVAMATAISVVDAIYTKEELDAEVETILLTDEDQQ